MGREAILTTPESESNDVVGVDLALPNSVDLSLFLVGYSKGTPRNRYSRISQHIADFLREAVDTVDLSWLPTIMREEVK